MVYLLTMGFIASDFLSGLIKAVKNKKLTSSKMREGLFHKIGSVACIGLSVLIEYSNQYFNFGFDIPLSNYVCTYIIVMEIASIFENIGEINPNLLNTKIKDIF